jgi:hypothetical protein
MFTLFLSRASVSGAANETENASSIGGERQSTSGGKGRGRASGRGKSRTIRGGVCSMVWEICNGDPIFCVILDL